MDTLKEKNVKEPAKPSLLVYLKVIFLTTIILFGVIVLNNLAKRQNQDQTNSGESGVANLFTGKNIKEALDNEVRTNDAYKTASSELNKTTANVLGEATRIKDQAVEQGKEFVTDYVYEQTVGSMVENMINRLPERQRDKVLKNVCAQ